MSITAATAVMEWGKTKINLIDTPGFNMFIHEAEMVLPAVEARWSWSTPSAASKSSPKASGIMPTSFCCRAPSSAPAWTASAPTSPA